MNKKNYKCYRLCVNKKFLAAYNEAVKADREFEDVTRWAHQVHQEWPKVLKGEVLGKNLAWANGRFLEALNEAHRTKRDLMRLVQDGMRKMGLIKEGGAQ